MKNDFIIYHNNRCTKSRCALALLQEKTNSIQIIDYLKNPPNEKTLKDLLKKLGIKAEEIIRKKENIFIELFKGKRFSENEWIKILSTNPILIERPIIIKGNKAVIGRPPENIYSLF